MGALSKLSLVAAGLALAAGTAHASAREDINGVWLVQPAYYLGRMPEPAPVLTPLGQGLVQRAHDAMMKGYVRSVGGMLCQGGGGPQLSQIRSPFEIFTGFGRMTMVFETEIFIQPRTFYLEEAVQPDNIFPSFNGHSIGHWEGDTLVVDTVGYNGRGVEPGEIPRSDKAHLVERFSLSDKGQVLTDLITVEDPVYLAKSWTFALKYDRQPRTEERIEVTCDVDLEAFNRVDLKALKDADPEVARLLDPDRNGSDPANRIQPGR